MHNIIFGMRSIICAALTWLSIYNGNTTSWRRVAVIGNSIVVLSAFSAADIATGKLCENKFDSTTATMVSPHFY